MQLGLTSLASLADLSFVGTTTKIVHVTSHPCMLATGLVCMYIQPFIYFRRNFETATLSRKVGQPSGPGKT